MNHAAINTGLQVSLWHSYSISFGDPPMRLLEHVVFLFLIFWGLSTLFSTVAVPIFPPTVHKSSLFSTSSPTLLPVLIIVILTGVKWYVTEVLIFSNKSAMSPRCILWKQEALPLPVYPDGHSQMNSPTRSLQIPLLRHGRELHSSTSVSHFKPKMQTKLWRTIRERDYENQSHKH